MQPDNKLREALVNLESERKTVIKKGQLFLLVAIVIPVLAYFLNLGFLAESLGFPSFMTYVLLFFLPIAYRAYDQHKLKGKIQEAVYSKLFESNPDFTIDSFQSIKPGLDQTPLLSLTNHNTDKQTKFHSFRVMTGNGSIELGRIHDITHIENGALYISYSSKFNIEPSFSVKPDSNNSGGFDSNHQAKSLDSRSTDLSNVLTEERKYAIAEFENSENTKPYYYFSRYQVAALIPFTSEIKEVNLAKTLTENENLDRLTTELSFYIQKAKAFKTLIANLKLA